MVLAKCKNMHQWKRVESPVITHIPTGNLYENEGKNIQWTKETSSRSGLGKTGQLHVKKRKTQHFLTLYKDLNMKPETTKLFEQNTGRALSHKSQQNPH